MRKSALLMALACLASAGVAQEVPRSVTAERARAIRREVVQLEETGRNRVIEERGLKPLGRSAVEPTQNVETFDAVSARYIRFTVLSTLDGSEPCLDALEVYAPDDPRNLAKDATVTASSIHDNLANFRQGGYGAGWCWVSRVRGSGWLQVELPKAKEIDRVVWGRDAQKRQRDRLPANYKVEISTDGRAWQTVTSGGDRAGLDRVVTRAAAVQALRPAEQKKRDDLLAELAQMGASWHSDIKSGPQVGGGVDGKFLVQAFNGLHNGKQCCPV